MGSRIEELATARFAFMKIELGRTFSGPVMAFVYNSTSRGKKWSGYLEVDLRHHQQDAYPLLTGNRTFILELNGKLTRGKIGKGLDLLSSTHFLKLQVKGDTLKGQGVGALAIRLIQQNIFARYLAGTLLEVRHFQKPSIDSYYVFLSLVIETARHHLLKHPPCLDHIKQIVSVPLKLTPGLISVNEARAINFKPNHLFERGEHQVLTRIHHQLPRRFVLSRHRHHGILWACQQRPHMQTPMYHLPHLRYNHHIHNMSNFSDAW